jgi:hypothetical protein
MDENRPCPCFFYIGKSASPAVLLCQAQERLEFLPRFQRLQPLAEFLHAIASFRFAIPAY